jgi:hypothetical protein
MSMPQLRSIFNQIFDGKAIHSAMNFKKDSLSPLPRNSDSCQALLSQDVGENCTSITALPKEVIAQIFSNCLPNPHISRVCKVFRDCVLLSKAQTGKLFSKQIDRRVWINGALPDPGIHITDEQGIAIYKIIMQKAQVTWNSFGSTSKAKFPGFSLQQLNQKPSLFNQLIIEDLVQKKSLHKQRVSAPPIEPWHYYTFTSLGLYTNSLAYMR